MNNLTKITMISRILNFSELSRYITGGDRNCIRANKVPKKWHNRIDQLIYKELPKYWEDVKAGSHVNTTES